MSAAQGLRRQGGETETVADPEDAERFRIQARRVWRYSIATSLACTLTLVTLP